MGTPKAKNTDAKVITRLKERVAVMTEENAQLRMSVLNIRQMYESVVGEKHMLNGQLGTANQILMAAVVSSKGQTMTVKAKHLANLDDYAGIDTKDQNGDLVLTALTVAEVAAMEESFEVYLEEDEEDEA